MAIAFLHESTPDEAGFTESAHAEASAKDRRAQVRLSAEDASWLRGARLKYGSDVRVIDISTGGILIESDGAPLAPQSNVVFELSAQTGTILMPARVLRSQPAEGSTRTQTACAFKRSLSVDAVAPPLAMNHRRQYQRLRAHRGSASSRDSAAARWYAATPTTSILQRRISI